MTQTPSGNAPDEVNTVTTWAQSKMANMTAAQQQNFLTYVVGLGLQSTPPLSAQAVMNTVFSALPAAQFGVFFEIASIETPAPTTPTA